MLQWSTPNNLVCETLMFWSLHNFLTRLKVKNTFLHFAMGMEDDGDYEAALWNPKP